MEAHAGQLRARTCIIDLHWFTGRLLDRQVNRFCRLRPLFSFAEFDQGGHPGDKALPYYVFGHRAGSPGDTQRPRVLLSRIDLVLVISQGSIQRRGPSGLLPSIASRIKTLGHITVSQHR
jgi:hypothetical protein